ncbi:DUF3800 domain-containing protein [Cupriavidus plantarum]|uniref:DUF3800 domain-containing protein n=1 Tax=Cupriavidus plantarum TaxID=942865 RepID=UPI001B235212|nr:DUF3800 domain-containing protein [Cupriavidus plantarum]CAG2144852.1 hypothetical protein LMG26296_03610 [Cupriavidus plantarum]SMR85977.1 Protein of unknown function [Cupriavidus plantarum]
MAWTFYLDESGHSGDAVKAGDRFDFKDQPFFVLAAVGLRDEKALSEKLSELRQKYRLPSGELKAKSLVSKPSFVGDLVTWLCKQELPIFVELVDKKYFIAIHIVNTQVLPPSAGVAESPGVMYFRNQIADFIYAYAPDEVFEGYVNACLAPSADIVRQSLQSQIDFATSVMSTTALPMVSEALRRMCIESLDDLEQMLTEDALAFQRFLPSPDRNKRDKLVWMLPNLTSFTSIYARINKYMKGEIANVRLVHDVQLEYENILRDAKGLTEELARSGELPEFPNANYKFSEASSLEFAVSHESVGIQVADLVAGTVMRFCRARKLGDEAQMNDHVRTLGVLLWTTDAETGQGVNQVVPAAEVMEVTRIC